MRLITFALMTSAPVLARQTNSSRPSRSSLAAFNISSNVLFPDGLNDGVHVKQPLGNLETTLGEERTRPPLPLSVGRDVHKAVGKLVTAMHGKNMDNLSVKYRDKLRSLESYAIMAYLETVVPAPLVGQHHGSDLYARKMCDIAKYQTDLVKKSLAESDRFVSSVRESVSKRQETELTPAMRHRLSEFQGTPGDLFRELKIAGGEEWNILPHMGNPFASPYLGALNEYRQTYNKDREVNMSLLDVFLEGYKDEARVVRMLALLRLSRIYSGAAQKMEKELLAKWLESGKTIGKVVQILRSNGNNHIKAYAVKGPLKRYILRLNTKYPVTEQYTAKILHLLEGNFSEQEMLAEVKKANEETRALLELKADDVQKALVVFAQD